MNMIQSRLPSTVNLVHAIQTCWQLHHSPEKEAVMPRPFDWPRRLVRRTHAAMAEHILGAVARAAQLRPDARATSILLDLQRQPVDWGTTRYFNDLNDGFRTRAETPC
jgi:hypothetical protein